MFVCSIIEILWW